MITKSPKTGQLIWLLAGCLLVAFVYMGADILNQSRQQVDLRNQMQTAGETLSLLPQPPADLVQRLEAARQANQSAKESIIYGQVDITKIIESILNTGDTYNLKVVPLTSTPWANRSVGGRTYKILDIRLDISGRLSDVMAFIDTLEKDGTAVTNNLTITPVATGGTSDTGADVSATLDLMIIAEEETS